MDIKTLEYMEERASKARQIVNAIERHLRAIDLIKRSRGVIDLYTPGHTVRLEISQSYSGELAKNNHATEAVAAIYNTFIDVTLAEIRNLEKQLEEL